MAIGKIKKSPTLGDWETDTSVLNPGDVWQQTDMNNIILREWTWDGARWNSGTTPRVSHSSVNALNLNSSTNIIVPISKENSSFLVEKLIIDYAISGTNSNSKYWDFNLFRISNSYGWSWLGGSDSKSNWFGEIEIAINQQDILAITNSIYYLLQANRISNPGNLSLAASLSHKQII